MKVAWVVLIVMLSCLNQFAGAESSCLLLRPDGCCVLPNGSVVAPTETRTTGLQEAIDLAVRENFDLSVMGGDFKSRVYSCSEPIVFPPMQGKSIRFGAATLDFNGFDDPTQPGMIFDSCMNVFFECKAQIVYHMNGTAVLLEPKNLLPVDTFVGPTMVASIFEFSAISHVNTPVSYVGRDGGLLREDRSVCCVAILPSHSITRCEFNFIELLGGNIGIRVETPESQGAFAFNRLSALFIHEQMNTSVFEGTIPESPENKSLRGNRWALHCAPHPGASGIEVHGNRGYWLVDVVAEKGPLMAGLRTDATTSGNTFILKNLDGGVKGPFSLENPGDNRFE